MEGFVVADIDLARQRKNGHRVLFPILTASVVAISFAGVALWPDEQFVPIMRMFVELSLVLLGVILLLVWFFSFGRFGRKTKFAGLAFVGVLAMVATFSIRRVEFGGTGTVFVQMRWQGEPDDPSVEQKIAVRPQQASRLRFRKEEMPTDFPEYRGRKRDAVVSGPKLARDWKSNPPRPLWSPPVLPIGGGYSQFAVFDDLLVTMEQREEKESVVCYSKSTGHPLWVYEYDTHFREVMGGDGPRATPTIFNGLVYSLGAEGLLTCVDLSDGHFLWSAQTLVDAGGNLSWAMAGSPLVFDNCVVVNPGVNSASGKPNTAVHCYDRLTGKLIWSAGTSKAGYAAPMLVTLGGRQQIVIFDADSVWSLDPKAGSEVWRFPWRPNGQGINVAQPVVLGDDKLFVCTGYGGGCVGLDILHQGENWKVRELWEKTKALKCQFSSPVLYNGFVYGIDESGGILTCVDTKTGKRVWREGRFPSGQILRCDDLLIVTSEKGEIGLVEASPMGFHELGRRKIFDEKSWNCPALSNGVLYLRNHHRMTCLDLRAQEAIARPVGGKNR